MPLGYNTDFHPHDPLTSTLLARPSRIPRSINRTLNMSRNTILARIKLTSNDAVLAQRASNLLSDLTNSAVGIDCYNTEPLAHVLGRCSTTSI